MTLHNPGRVLSQPPPYHIPYSLRFAAGNSPYLDKTFGGIGTGAQRIWTWRGLVRRADLVGMSSGQMLFEVNNPSSPLSYLAFSKTGMAGSTNNDGLVFRNEGGGTVHLETNAVFRDLSEYYDIVLGCDTTQATAANRLALAVNGRTIASFATATYPSLNQQMAPGGAFQFVIGGRATGSFFCNVFMTEIAFIDGQMLGPSSFGKFVGGTWKPRRLHGLTYGTNGFYLPFNPAKYGDAVTLTNVCKDKSGNSNHFTGHNLDATSTGPTLDFLNDSPTAWSNGHGACAIINALDRNVNAGFQTITGAGLITTSSNDGQSGMTFAADRGKWYWEIDIIGALGGGGPVWLGIESAPPWSTYAPNSGSGGRTYRSSDGSKLTSNTATAYGASLTNGDNAAVAWDADNGTLEFFKNGTSQGVAFTSLSGLYYIVAAQGSGSIAWNMGSRPFAHTPPAGFKAPHNGNLPRPTISPASSGFNNAVAAGSAIVSTIAAKRAGWATYVDIYKNTANAEDWKIVFSDDPTNMLAFNTTAAKAALTAPVSGDNYMGCTLRIGSLYGTFTTTVAHVNGVADTIAHGLGSARKMVLLKRTDGVSNWFVWHPDLTAGNLVYLNSTGGQTADTSVSVDATNVTVASALATGTYRVLVIADAIGLTKLTNYAGNSSATTGPHTWLGHRPGLVLLKNFSTTSAWIMATSSQSPFNPTQEFLLPNSSSAQTSNSDAPGFDMTSNGLKQWTSTTDLNGSGSYLVLSFAETYYNRARAR